MTYEEMLSQAVEGGTDEDLGREIYRFENSGDGIVGRVLGWEALTLTEGQGTVNSYTIETDDGVKAVILGAPTDRNLEGRLRIGDLISIVYKGKVDVRGGKQRMNTFDIRRFGHSDLK